LPWAGQNQVSSGSTKIRSSRSSIREVKSVGFVVLPGPPGTAGTGEKRQVLRLAG
jgi:hypothetical protein